MKTKSINLDHFFTTGTLIIAFLLLPTISFSRAFTTLTLSTPSAIENADLESDEEIDEWMLDLTTWIDSYSENFELEEEMVIEDWMINIDNEFWQAEVVEEEMAIEEWMLNINHEFDLCQEETDIIMEKWMHNPSIW